MTRIICLTGLLFLCAGTTAISKDRSDSTYFETDVRPILKKHCFHCHGEEEELGGELDLRLVRFMKHGGDSGPAVVPGDAEESLIYQRLADGEMPPDASKLLSDAELRTVKDWIASGAQTRRDEPEAIDEATWITEEERSHWAYQPVVRPVVPTVANTAAVANPIDSFVLSRLQQQGFSLSPRASSNTLTRRLFFDVTGLPPSPRDIAASVTMTDQTSWHQLVDRLLSSHQYGERWARHWLDIAGYSDSEGYTDSDVERRHAWRYRDYVIRAFNEDMPYDQFIREQLAGDALIQSPLKNLSPEDARVLAATGFLRMAPDGTASSPPDMKLAVNDCISDTVKIVTSSLMAMTVGCAQCHDHRYDPISQVDYYRFRAIFEPALNPSKWLKPTKRRVSLYTDADRQRAAEIEKEATAIDVERRKKEAEFIKATFEKQLKTLPSDVHEQARIAHGVSAKKRTKDQKALFKKYPKLNVTASSLYLYDSKAAAALKELSAEAAAVRSRKPKEGYVRALTQPTNASVVTRVLFRGDHEQPRQEVKPGGLSVVSLSSNVGELELDPSENGAANVRMRLADRLTHRDHPLTARVIANRIWAHHFGVGIVTSMSDFGVLGQKPTHPALLDWLAAELMENRWSLKHLHRLILTSNTWQQQLRTDAELRRADPDNRLIGGARLRRLDAEVLRDSMLAITGRLNAKPYGPSVPVMADRVGRFVVGIENNNAGRPGKVIDLKGEQLRRSIYIQARRSRPLSVFATFDRPAMTPNCDRRRPSTNSTQSLLMLNSDLVLGYARDLAARLRREHSDNVDQQLRVGWQLIYGRNGSDEELRQAKAFLYQQTDHFAAQAAYKPNQKKPPVRSAEEESLALVCHMLLSSNEFLYVD